jgi:hypothetical protein
MASLQKKEQKQRLSSNFALYFRKTCFKSIEDFIVESQYLLGQLFYPSTLEKLFHIFSNSLELFPNLEFQAIILFPSFFFIEMLKKKVNTASNISRYLLMMRMYPTFKICQTIFIIRKDRWLVWLSKKHYSCHSQRFHCPIERK